MTSAIATIAIKYNGKPIGTVGSIDIQMGYYGSSPANGFDDPLYKSYPPDLLRAHVRDIRFDKAKLGQAFGTSWERTNCLRGNVFDFEVLFSDGTSTILKNVSLYSNTGLVYDVDDYFGLEQVIYDIETAYWAPSRLPETPLTTKSIQGLSITPEEPKIEPIKEKPKPLEEATSPAFTAMAVVGTLMGAFLNKVFDMQKEMASVRVSDPSSEVPLEYEDIQQEANTS